MHRYSAHFLRKFSQTASGLLIISVACFAGCSQDANSVAGRVTLDGNPLPDAIVQFIPQGTGGRIALGRTDENGEYRLKSSRTITDVSPGNYSVQITTSDFVESDEMDGRKSKELVPSRFNTKSELVKEIKPGANQIDFELPSN
jgi:hypothetical protein